MKPNSQNLHDVLSRQIQYVVPVFQRFYRWEQPQWEKLWENILDLRSPESRGQHFMGFLVFVPEINQLDFRLHVIDGQQRLTTLSLLLVAVRNTAEENGFNEFAHEITDKYLLDPHRSGDEGFRVLLKLRDRQEYEAAVTGEDAPDGRITKALAYFQGKLTELPELSEVNGLRRFLALVMTKFEFICATLEDDKPYNIFKSLNSTGVPLGAADLVRNFVFMHLKPERHDEFDRRLWSPLERHFTRANGVIDDDTLSAFMRDFLMRDGRYVRAQREKVFEIFEDRYTATGFSADALATDLNRFADYYMVIRGEREDRHAAVTTALEQINSLRHSTTYPLLLQLFEKRNQAGLSDSDLARAIELLVGFILRRNVCGLDTRRYGEMFTKACASVDTSPMESLERYLLSNGHPHTARFKSAFVGCNLYENRYSRFILTLIEESSGHREPAVLAGADIEHVMPQTLTHHWRHDLGPEADRIYAQWLHAPGNLTLSAYNQELANRPFSEKRVRYAQSNIGMTRDLAKFERWGEPEIRQRGEAMAEVAAKIWLGPSEPSAVPDGIRELDPENPPNLSHSRILEGHFSAIHVFSWRELVDAAVLTSQQEGLALPDLAQIARVQDHDPGGGYFRRVEGTNPVLWVPGMDANQCWRRSFRLAQAKSTDIKIVVEWEDIDGAAFPGERAILRWAPR